MSHTQDFNTYNIKKPFSQIYPFSQLYAAYVADPASEHLRFGQWVYNQFPTGYHGQDVDTLYNTRDNKVALEIIRKIYEDYQWPT